MSGTSAGTTSGTVLGYTYPQRKVIDHALRKAGYSPQDMTSEWIQVAQDLLFVQLAEYVNYGFPLWTRQLLLLPIAIGSTDVPMPNGTVDAFHVYWRRFNVWRGTATDQTGAFNLSALIGGQANSDIGISGPNPGVEVNFGTATEVDTIGILPGFTTGDLINPITGLPILDGNGNDILSAPSQYAAKLQVMISQDGINWSNAQTLPLTTFKAGVWSYFDLNPTVSAPFMQIMQPGVPYWLLNQVIFGLSNFTDVQIGPSNIDDYYDLPNRAFQSGMPNTSFVDRQLDSPIIKIWPTPNSYAFYNGTITALVRRYIQDPGSMTDTLEIPVRWFEGVTARLGIRLMDELPDPGAQAQASYFGLIGKQQRRTNLEQTAAKAEAGMQAEERSRSPIRITPNLHPYTA